MADGIKRAPGRFKSGPTSGPAIRGTAHRGFRRARKSDDTTCKKTGKIRFKYLWQATRALKRLNDAGMGVYRCISCGRLHIGHQKDRAHDRISQLLDRVDG